MTAYADTLIQDAPDGPGPLTQANDGQFMVWNAQQRRFDMATLRVTGGGAVRALASRIQDAPDGPGSLGAGDDGKALVWDNSAGAFVMTAFEEAGAVAAHVAESDPHAGYLLATGSRTGASSQAQTFTNGVVLPIIQPVADATDAIQIKTAAGSQFITVNTTNRRLRIDDGNTPAAALISTDALVVAAEGTAPGSAIISAGSSASNRAVYKGVRARGTLASPTAPSSSDQVLSFLAAIYDGASVQATGLVDFLVDGSVSSGVAPCRIAFYTSATNSAGRTERMRIASDGKITLGTGGYAIVNAPSTTAPALDIICGTGSQLAMRFTDVTTDATSKQARFVSRHYSNSEEDVLMFYANNSSGTNQVNLGGGSGFFNTVNDWRIYCAPDNTTTTGTAVVRITSTGVAVGHTNTPAAWVHIAGNQTAAAWGANGIAFRSTAATYTDSSTAGSGTASTSVANGFGRPTFAASNSSVTMTDAATVYIANSPAAGTNVTLTNAYALWVDDGAVRLDGNIGFFATAPASKQTVTGSRGANAALASLLTALAAYGLITDSSSA